MLRAIDLDGVLEESRSGNGISLEFQNVASFGKDYMVLATVNYPILP